MPMKPPFVSLHHIPNKTMTIFIRQFTRKVRVISHKSELCSHFKAYFEGSGTTFAIIDILPTIVAFTCCCIFLKIYKFVFHERSQNRNFHLNPVLSAAVRILEALIWWSWVEKSIVQCDGQMFSVMVMVMVMSWAWEFVGIGGNFLATRFPEVWMVERKNLSWPSSPHRHPIKMTMLWC